MINDSPRSAPAVSSAISNRAHGALRLTELHRFTDPAEAASHALREGNPSGLGFYLDHGRIHVGDGATTTEDAFNAWVSDRAAGLDTIMIASTRDLVAQLNRRGRAHCLDHFPAASEVTLADGNRASAGDVIITRTNDRRLCLTPTDWVKNGDRWTVTRVGKQGDLTVRHTRSHRIVRLPPTTFEPRPVSATPPPSTAPKAWPPTLCTAWLQNRSPASSGTRCPPRTDRQPPLLAGRRRRRPAHPHPTRGRHTS
jgi:hypothetical protein